MTPSPTKRRFRRRYLAAAAVIGLAALATGGVLQGRATIAEIAATLPATPDIASLPVSTVVVDREGLLLRPFTTADGRWRLPVSLEEVDRRYIEMLLAYEDRNFRGHHGIDWTAMLRAATQFAGAGGQIVSGGSTLTMQVARLIEQQPTRSLWGKARQMVHADALEKALSKDNSFALPDAGAVRGQHRGGPRCEPCLFR